MLEMSECCENVDYLKPSSHDDGVWPIAVTNVIFIKVQKPIT